MWEFFWHLFDSSACIEFLWKSVLYFRMQARLWIVWAAALTMDEGPLRRMSLSIRWNRRRLLVLIDCVVRQDWREYCLCAYVTVLFTLRTAAELKCTNPVCDREEYRGDASQLRCSIVRPSLLSLGFGWKGFVVNFSVKRALQRTAKCLLAICVSISVKIHVHIHHGII